MSKKGNTSPANKSVSAKISEKLNTLIESTEGEVATPAKATKAPRIPAFRVTQNERIADFEKRHKARGPFLVVDNFVYAETCKNPMKTVIPTLAKHPQIEQDYAAFVAEVKAEGNETANKIADGLSKRIAVSA